jgi:hypothetical protein
MNSSSYSSSSCSVPWRCGSHQMHAIMQVAEQEHWPCQQGDQCERLIKPGNCEAPQHDPTCTQDRCRGNYPFQPHISQSNAALGGVLVAGGAHGLARSIEVKMMNHVSTTEGGKFLAVHQTMQEITSQFRKKDRSAELFVGQAKGVWESSPLSVAEWEKRSSPSPAFLTPTCLPRSRIPVEERYGPNTP